MPWQGCTIRCRCINSDGTGATRYARRLGPGEVEAWVIATFSGIEAEFDRFGGAPVITGDLDVIEKMVRTPGLSWSTTRMDRFRNLARGLVARERSSIRLLARTFHCL
jgi:hypothetical protein